MIIAAGSNKTTAIGAMYRRRFIEFSFSLVRKTNETIHTVFTKEKNKRKKIVIVYQENKKKISKNKLENNG